MASLCVLDIFKCPGILEKILKDSIAILKIINRILQEPRKLVTKYASAYLGNYNGKARFTKDPMKS